MSARFGFPINLAVHDRRCVVVGGGEEAALRVLWLRDAGADLVVVTPDPCPQLRELLDHRVEHRARTWRPADLDGAILVIGTREDPIDEAHLHEQGKARGALVNVLDDVQHGDYAAMSQVVHGDLHLSIATNGKAPAVALADTDGLLGRLRAGERDAVRDHVVEVVRGDHGGPHHGGDRPGPDGTTVGGGEDPARPDAGARVHLVGAGPGDPDLLTVRAARLLAEAELVVHDQLVAPSILALADPGAEVVAVGRRLGHVVVAHEDVVDLLADAAHAGRAVVRLKGGDPVVFGRGGEEALELAGRGVAAELVPGVSSAVAAPELAGIPLTHRGLASGFLVVTGQHAASITDHVDWELAARFAGTLVVLMGATRLREICGELQGFGRAPTTPAAIVERAGHPQQRVVTGILGDLAERAHAAGIGTPAVVVVGDVVDLRAAVDQALDEALAPPVDHPEAVVTAPR